MYSRHKHLTRLQEAFLQLQPPLGDLLITQTNRNFHEQMRSFQSHVLRQLFPAGILVITRSDKYKLHAHAIVQISGSSSMNWVAFEESNRWQKIYRHTHLPAARQLHLQFRRQWQSSLSPQLRHLNALLNYRARKYKLGKVYLLPVRKNNHALLWYLAKNLPHKTTKEHHRPTQVSGLKLAPLNTYKPLTPRYQEYRRKLKHFCQALQLNEENYKSVLRSLLGRNWHWRCRTFIQHFGELDKYNLTPRLLSLKEQVKTHLIRLNDTCSTNSSLLEFN